MFHFFAYLSRLKLIDRWSLMRCIQRENVAEHSLQVSTVAHALALIAVKKFAADVDPQRVALLAVFHDATEVITGDLPTPVKYFNGQIRDAYRAIESHATAQLLRLLPAEFQDDYRELLLPGDRDHAAVRLIKAADTICAYAKCLEERAAGNQEFSRAQKSIEEKLAVYRQAPEVDYFLRTFAPSFALTLDEISRPLEVT